MSLIEILFKNKKKSDGIFFIKNLKQNRYDIEIDEGFSSGLVRYNTLDITGKNKLISYYIANKIADKFTNYNLCKQVEVVGFNLNDKKYITISGESHFLYIGEAKHYANKDIKKIMENFKIKSIDEYIKTPNNSSN